MGGRRNGGENARAGREEDGLEGRGRRRGRSGRGKEVGKAGKAPRERPPARTPPSQYSRGLPLAAQKTAPSRATTAARTAKCRMTQRSDARLVLDVRRWSDHTLRIHAASSSLFSHFSSAASCTRRRRAWATALAQLEGRASLLSYLIVSPVCVQHSSRLGPPRQALAGDLLAQGTPFLLKMT